MHFLMLFISLGFWAHADGGNVVRLERFRERNACELLLKPDNIRHFPFAHAVYQDSGSFLQEMNSEAGEAFRYFYYVGQAPNPLSPQSADDWTERPNFLNEGPVFILKTAALAGLPAGRVNLRTLRVRTQLLTFTRVTTPRIYFLIKTIIEGLRMLHHNAARENFEPVALDHGRMYAGTPLSYRLEDLINSWPTVNPHEHKVKHLLKIWLHERGRNDDLDSRQAMSQLIDRVRAEFKDSGLGSEILVLLEDFRD